MNKRQSSVQNLALTALMAALCYIGFTFFKINIPVGEGSTAIHFGNTFCVLAALMLGGVQGGMAGAIGMGIGDLLDPLYVTSFPKTFILKFCIGLCAGFVAKKVGLSQIKDQKQLTKYTVLSCVAGMAFNVLGEPIVSYFYSNFILGVNSEVAKFFMAWTAGTTLFNAMTSVIIASSLYLALRKALKNSNLGQSIFR